MGSDWISFQVSFAFVVGAVRLIPAMVELTNITLCQTVRLHDSNVAKIAQGRRHTSEGTMLPGARPNDILATAA